MNSSGVDTILLIVFGAATALIFWEWQKQLEYKIGLDYSEIMSYAFIVGWGAMVLLESWLIFLL